MKKRVRVEAPFVLLAENKKFTMGDEIEVSEETLAAIRKVNVNMVTVLGDVPEEETEMTKIPEEKSREEVEEKKARKPRTKKTEE